MTDEQLIKRISEMSVSIFGEIDGINLAKLTKNFKEEFVRRIIVKSQSASGQKSLIKTIREKYIEWKRETDITYKMLPLPFGGREYLYPKYMEDLYFRIDCGEIIEAEEFTMISSWDDAPSAHSSDATAELNSRIAELNSRIAELEKENEALKQQLAPEEHCEEEEEHCPEEGVLRNKVSFECFLQLLEQAGCDLNNTGNKTRAGTLWRMMTGKSAHELRRYCSGRNYNNNHTKTDIARLDTFLSDLGITSLKLRQ